MTVPRSIPAMLIMLHLIFYASFLAVRYWLMPVPILEAVILGGLLVWISVVDVMRMEIPDLAALLLFLTGGAFVFFGGSLFWDHLVASVLWPMLFWVVGGGYSWIRGWQGLGFGDVKLMAGIGIWLGFAQTTLVVFASALAGIVVIVMAKLVHRKTFSDIGITAVAFGPFLCLSAWVIWLF